MRQTGKATPWTEQIDIGAALRIGSLLIFLVPPWGILGGGVRGKLKPSLTPIISYKCMGALNQDACNGQGQQRTVRWLFGPVLWSVRHMCSSSPDEANTEKVVRGH